MQGISCEQARAAMAQRRALIATEWAHLEKCEACLDAWVSYGLGAKPEVGIPVDFAARVAAALPENRNVARESGGQERGQLRIYDRHYDRHWGLMTAIVLVAVGLIAMQAVDPIGLNTRMGLLFMGIVASEIAGIALWLGLRHPGERQS